MVASYIATTKKTLQAENTLNSYLHLPRPVTTATFSVSLSATNMHACMHAGQRLPLTHSPIGIYTCMYNSTNRQDRPVLSGIAMPLPNMGY